ncbi:MAG: hypothetical protein ABSG61_02115 [Gemmatimonadales bacterium]|jgi:hypothetical protein
MRVRACERGIALAAAIFALVALAALLAGLWFAALQEYRVGANVVSDRRAFDAAEAGLDAALAGWNPGSLNRLAVNDTAAFSGALAGGAATYSGVVQRLGPWLFLVRSTGADARGSSRRTLATVARLSPLRLGVEAALVASGPVRLGAGSLVDALATDTGGTCARASPAAGIVVGDGAALDVSGCRAESCVRGSPASSVDTTFRNAPVPLLGEAGWAGLVAVAEMIGPRGLLPTESHVWFAPGDFSLAAGAPAGAGVLLVQGDLVVESGAQLTGLVVVRGRLIVRGAGATIVGAVLAGGAELSALDGARANLLHSSCAVEQALAAAAPARRLGERSWTALYPDAQ